MNNNLISLENQILEPSVQQQIMLSLGSKERAKNFVASLFGLLKENPALLRCSESSIINGALQIANLGLSLNRSLGHAALVPYAQKQGKAIAQVNVMYAGLIQLCLRTKEYKKIIVTPIYKDEFVSWDKINMILEYKNVFSEKRRLEDVHGYYAEFELASGLRMADYWSIERVKNHAEKYSASYGVRGSVWDRFFNEMACKTVLKLLLKKFGLIDIHLSQAIEIDQAAFEGENGQYIDAKNTIDLKEEDIEPVTEVSGVDESGSLEKKLGV